MSSAAVVSRASVRTTVARVSTSRRGTVLTRFSIAILCSNFDRERDRFDRILVLKESRPRSLALLLLLLQVQLSASYHVKI